MNLIFTILVFVAFSAVPASASEKGHEMKGSSNEAVADLVGEPTGKQASALMTGTSEDSQISGEVVLAETNKGVFVNAVLTGVQPGKHGFHIHEKGSCEDGGKAAGGHFNPSGVEHGLLTRDGHEKAHAGDMGNIVIGEDGSGELSVLMPEINLSEGDNYVVGKAVILHAKEDDFGQPTGNAGGRIGCGIIQLKSE